MTPLRNIFRIAAIATVLANPTLAKEPVVDMSDPSLATIDGLYPVKHTRIDRVYVQPELDLSAYKRVMVAPVSIAYKRKSFELSQEQIDRMRQYFSDAVQKHLSKKGYTLTNEPGPDVLQVNANIVDLYVNRKPEQTTGRSAVFTASSGEMTLIGELRDSRSGEILVRFADHQRPRSYWAKSTSVSEWTEVRRAFNFWADVLGDRLEDFHSAGN